jgi:hypothetical protein
MDKKKYIYESPDGGKTLYRREFGNYKSRELVPDNEIKHSKHYYDVDRNRPFNDGQAKQSDNSVLNRNLEFKNIADMLSKASLFGLEIEVIWSSIRAMKESNGEILILTALQRGANEWDI